MIFRSKKYKCEFCKKKHKQKKTYVLKISCLDDDTGEPITIDKRACEECATTLEKIREEYDRKAKPI